MLDTNNISTIKLPFCNLHLISRQELERVKEVLRWDKESIQIANKMLSISLNERAQLREQLGAGIRR